MIDQRLPRLRRCAPVLFLLLASCATQVPVPPTAPRGTPAPPALPAPLPDEGAPPSTAPTGDIWSRLRGSFEMDDCDSDPAVQQWARRFTASPTRFEQTLRRSLPRLAFIQSIAEKHGVAGEFVLLPWVESRYRPVHGHGRQPAGMWQIVPITAGALGLRVNRKFDGRMDVPKATEAVMELLGRYQEQFHDWRLTDYAYNAGEFAVRRLLARHGVPPADPVIPRLPVRNVTREHLIKLLAIACVVREPERFHVTLPALPAEQHLVTVPVSRPMSMTEAAQHAGISVDALRRYNSAFLTNRIDPDLSSNLLLPDGHADQFRNSVSQPYEEPIGNVTDAAESTDISSAPRSHTVREGESLWLIAHRYGLSVRLLRQWNKLQKGTIKPGQVLALQAPSS